MKKNNLSGFGAKLKSLRGMRPQAEMAAFFNVGAVAYGNWERGDKQPSIITLRDICLQFKVSSDWLLGLSESPKQDSMNVFEQREDYGNTQESCPECRRKAREIEQKKAIIDRLSASVDKLSGSILDLTAALTHKKNLAPSSAKGILC